MIPDLTKITLIFQYLFLRTSFLFNTKLLTIEKYKYFLKINLETSYRAACHIYNFFTKINVAKSLNGIFYRVEHVSVWTTLSYTVIVLHQTF